MGSLSDLRRWQGMESLRGPRIILQITMNLPSPSHAQAVLRFQCLHLRCTFGGKSTGRFGMAMRGAFEKMRERRRRRRMMVILCMRV